MSGDFPDLFGDSDYLEKSEDKIMDKNVFTSFFFGGDIIGLIDWAKKKSMTFKDLGKENQSWAGKYEILLGNKTIGIAEDVSDDEDCVIFRISKDDVTTSAYKMITDYFEGVGIFPAEISYGEEEFPIHDAKIIGKSWTWVNADIEWGTLPVTYFEFYLNKKLIAKMSMVYYDWEMHEAGPTIEKFEVAVGIRGKGYGEKIIKTIEERLAIQGFSKLWLEKTFSEGFWKKLGYEIDIDEGYKYLEFPE